MPHVKPRHRNFSKSVDNSARLYRPRGADDSIELSNLTGPDGPSGPNGPTIRYGPSNSADLSDPTDRDDPTARPRPTNPNEPDALSTPTPTATTNPTNPTHRRPHSPYSFHRRSTNAAVSGSGVIICGQPPARVYPSSGSLAVASSPSFPPQNCWYEAWSR